MKPIPYKPNQVRLFLAILYVVVMAALLRSGPGLRPVRLPAAALSAACLLLALLPRWFFPAFRVILGASGRLGSLFFSLLTVFVVYLVLSPLSLVMRLLGKRFLHVRFRPRVAAASYYEEGEAAGDMSRQF